MKDKSLKVFYICLISCAGLFLSVIWLFREPPEELMKLTVSLFVIGLAAFLIWFVSTVKEIWQNLKK